MKFILLTTLLIDQVYVFGNFEHLIHILITVINWPKYLTLEQYVCGPGPVFYWLEAYWPLKSDLYTT